MRKLDSDSPVEALSALKRFAQTRPQVERCELCSAPLEPLHQHLLDRKSKQIACACAACSILFCDQDCGKFLRVPREVLQLHDFAFTDLQWEEMMLPINLAFFYRNEEGCMTAIYPSPAGAIESQINFERWNEQWRAHRRLIAMQPEVEALIVNRVGTEPMYFVAPIDECYRLTGVIRTRWRGLSGGTDVWVAITEFFQDLKRKAGGASEVRHA
ncbi:MAG TPA: DUF5947 family protein [Terracidiphilus sp.]|jgi:hypothetical protein